VRWLGKCPECQQWNTLIEEEIYDDRGKASTPGVAGGPAVPLARVEGVRETRLATGLTEFDRILGGGAVAGSVVLIGGEPGVGKSTLLLQVLAGLAISGRRVLYVTGEESASQIRMRAERLGVIGEDLFVLAETSLERIVSEIRKVGPAVVVIDSVQAVYSDRSPSPPGTIVQIREAARQLAAMAKGDGITAFLIGHVTKEGSLAGPKVLEHVVDTVLYFEGDPGHLYRIVRSTKNRYGSTNEVGLFRMGDDGLKVVENPSELFLGDSRSLCPGTVVIPSLEGQRPILIEVQALVSSSGLASGRRSSSGLDLSRVIMLLAVLEKRAGMIFGSADVYVNASGGLRLVEPAADLGVLLALASSHRDVPLGGRTAVFGEVGLTGEVRGVHGAFTRVKEASKLGFQRCMIPSVCREQMKNRPLGIEVLFVSMVEEALEVFEK
jgi:DNA repair protein RadA/Sms